MHLFCRFSDCSFLSLCSQCSPDCLTLQIRTVLCGFLVLLMYSVTQGCVVSVCTVEESDNCMTEGVAYRIYTGKNICNIYLFPLFNLQICVHLLVSFWCWICTCCCTYTGGMCTVVTGGEFQCLHGDSCHSQQDQRGLQGLQIHSIRIFIMCDGIAICGSVPPCVITTQDPPASPSQHPPHCRHGD